MKIAVAKQTRVVNVNGVEEVIMTKDFESFFTVDGFSESGMLSQEAS